MTSKKSANIPIELLRRSCRNHSQKVSQVGARTAIKKRSPAETEGATPEKIKRIKSEPVLKVKCKTERGKKIGHQISDCGTKSNTSTTTNSTLTNPPEPEGFLEVEQDELDLERTLLGGQTFRWTKSQLSNGQPIFTGVVLDYALQLWRVSPDKIAFKTLNKEAQEIKISKKIAMLEDYFQLKYKLKNLYYEWSSNDEHLAKCCESYRGFRILRQDPAENVFSFICATNNNIKRISQMIDKLCRRYGNILENCDDKSTIYDSFQSFPGIERLAQDDVFQCLRYELGFGYRAKFINETARQVVKLSQNQQKTPQDYLLNLRNLPYKDTCKQLMQLPGIGRKVADCICLMSMDHLNAVPIDCHIYEIVCRNYLPNLRKERKTLTDTVHDLIADYFKTLHGPLAGWSTSVLFIAELKHLKQDT